MKFASSLVLAAASACWLCSTTLAADPKDEIVASMKAQNDAPAYRMKIVSTDTNSKAVTSIMLESVNPDGMHMKTEAGGQVAMEMISDGKRTLISQGGGELQEAPAGVSAMIGQARKSATMEAMIQTAKDVKMAGHESVNGSPATVYTFNTEMSGMQSTNKLWVGDKDHRPVKSEGEVHGSVAMGGEPGTKVDQKVVVSYDYDPSIKIVLPPAK